jgi:hypothetical protein
MSIEKNEAADDLIWGCAAIAAAIGRNRRATFHLLENQLLPARKVGERWVASRKKLLATLTGDERAA